jgi:lysophospholipase L1-like esterase
MSPPLIKPECYIHGDFSYPEAPSYAKAFASTYEKMCQDEGVHYLNAALHAEPSEEDGAHLDEKSHERLAQAVWKEVQRLLT